MYRKKFALLALLLLVLTAIGVSGYAYQSERTPEYALEQAAAGLRQKDSSKVSRYVDVDGLVTAAYDESTEMLAENIGKLSQMYPKDWFFRHDTAFMKDYIANRRSDDLVFIHRVLELHLDPAIQPISRSDGQAKWLSDEADKFEQNYSAELKSVQKSGGSAQAKVEIRGKDTAYGRLVPKAMLELSLEEQPDGHWMITRVSNVGELFYPVIQGIEDYWTLQGWQE